MSDTLNEEEQIEQLKKWWDENGTSLLVGLVLAVGAVVGWRWYDASQARAVEEASQLYDSFVNAEGEARISLGTQIDERIPATSYQVLSLFYRAREAHDAGDVEATEALLREALAAAPDATLADLARLRLARVVQQLERSDEALTTLFEIRSSGFRTHALELKGDIHMARKERTLAHEAYREAVEALAENENRPVLEMKMHDTADAASA
ncbi:MAG: tetratricopeptide repeat protein [Pseudomonadales bacterium]|nr:tetratricopeptide repeat protein [Pseudomonadales bacterium]MDP6471640.1 tetratricopeptide repeat protein [Pseudomonadales bacterium]MDP6973074.1 tetratricopeptide repeat protein [Pseudomonadales bacterium]